MIIYKRTFANIKTLDCDFPIEDQYYCDNNYAIVADGITRDAIGIVDKSKVSFEEIKKKYPRPSGAEMAAKVIVSTFENTEGTLKEKLIKCNKEVKKLNDKYIKKCDYLENDYYGAVASCVHINNNVLEYAYICDCGVIVYDNKGNIKFQTDDDKVKYTDPYITNIGIPWGTPEARVIIRRDYRNNLEKIIDGNCVSYGAITGEESAISFIRTGEIELQNDDIIIVYSDGFTNFLHEQSFINEIINFNKESFEKYIQELSLNNYKSYGKEKTLIIMKQN